MTWYLFDTDGIVDYLKGVSSTIALVKRLNDERHQICACDVVVCEVHSGLSSPEQRSRAELLLSALEYLPTSREAAQRAGDWRFRHRAQGVQLAATDCLIAAVAHEFDAQIVTANLRDFPQPEVTVFPLQRAQGGASN